MNTQQIYYCQNDIFFAANTQNFIDVLKIKIPFCFWQSFVNMRFELLYLHFSFDRRFENENHFFDKVVSNFSKLSIVILNPSTKPISIIFSIRASDSFLIIILTFVMPFSSLKLYSHSEPGSSGFSSLSAKELYILKLVLGVMEVYSWIAQRSCPSGLTIA